MSRCFAVSGCVRATPMQCRLSWKCSDHGRASLYAAIWKSQNCCPSCAPSWREGDSATPSGRVWISSRAFRMLYFFAWAVLLSLRRHSSGQGVGVSPSEHTSVTLPKSRNDPPAVWHWLSYRLRFEQLALLHASLPRYSTPRLHSSRALLRGYVPKQWPGCKGA